MAKINFEDLIKTRQLQREPNIGKDQVERLLKRADIDLKSAASLKDSDPALAMDVAYKAMFHAGGALLRIHGLRPGPIRQHQGVIEAVGRILGPETEILMSEFDRLRKRRNQFEYQGLFEMGGYDLDKALRHAEELVKIIQKEAGQ